MDLVSQVHMKGQAGWGFKQPGLVKDVPARTKDVWTR